MCLCMACYDFSWPVTVLGKSRPHFWGGDICRADSITAVIAWFCRRVLVGKLDIGFEPWWWSGTFHCRNVLSEFGRDRGLSLWAEKSIHIWPGPNPDPAELWSLKSLGPQFIQIFLNGHHTVTCYLWRMFAQITILSLKFCGLFFNSVKTLKTSAFLHV
jgi:hypothetical protein